MNGNKPTQFNPAQLNQPPLPPRHRFLTGQDKQQFSSELDDYVEKGWAVVNIQTHINWSESDKEMKFGFLAILVKQGL